MNNINEQTTSTHEKRRNIMGISFYKKDQKRKKG